LVVDDDLTWVAWECTVCGESNEAPVDPAQGLPQKFTEDCRTCCRPNLLRITRDSEGDLMTHVVFDE